MQKVLIRLACLAITLQLMVSCTVLDQLGVPNAGLASIQNQRTANASLALHDLEEIDTLIKLNNNWLDDQIIRVLN